MNKTWKIVGLSVATIGAISAAVLGTQILVKKIRAKKINEITEIPQLEAPKDAVNQGAYQKVEQSAIWCRYCLNNDIIDVIYVLKKQIRDVSIWAIPYLL